MQAFNIWGHLVPGFGLRTIRFLALHYCGASFFDIFWFQMQCKLDNPSKLKHRCVELSNRSDYWISNKKFKFVSKIIFRKDL
jgi:hypothetical protein